MIDKNIVDTVYLSTLSNDRVIYLYTLVATHQNKNPDHGFDCACMDGIIQQLRDTLLNPSINLAEKEKVFDGNLNRYFESISYKIHKRWQHVLSSASAYRSY